MKITVLNWRDFDHPEAGGAELYTQRVARELAKRGDEVTFVTSRSPGTSRRTELDGYTILRRGGRYTVYPAVLWHLLTHRRRIDAVIDSQNGIPFFSPAVLPRRTPIALLMHHVHQEQFALYFSPAMAAVGRWLESAGARRVYRRRAIAAVSPSTRAAVRTELRLKGTIRLAPCGLEDPTDAVRVRADKPRIVSVGRLVPHKQVDQLIAAMPEIARRIPDVELHIVGDGTERAALTAQAEQLGLGDRVTFHGRVSDEERDRLLSSAWVTANTTRGEGWGLSVMEANRLGVGSVAFRVDGIRDSVIDGVTGWLVPEGSTLTDTLVQVLDSLADPQLDRQVESATRAWASSFTWANTTQALRNLLREEHDRLNRSDDRRNNRSDLMTMVTIPADVVPEQWSPALRTGDVLKSEMNGYRLLLAGIDQSQVKSILLRYGLSEAAVTDGRITSAVAGQQETLLSAAGLLAES